MNFNLLLGFLLLVVAAALLYFGYTASRSVGERVHETFTGRFTDSTIWYFVFGIAAAIGGLMMLSFGYRV